MNWDRFSLNHFRHLRTLPMDHLSSSLDYCIRGEGNTLYVAFQETSSYDNDISDDLNYFPEAIDVYTGVKGHGGVFKQYKSIREKLLNHLYSGNYKQIYVSGYSLGGALTVATIQDMGWHIDRDKLNVKIFGIAYNPPRTFCLSRIVKQATKDRLLIVCTRWDPIVHVPCNVMIMSWTLQLKPLRIVFGKPTQWISFWKHYGKVVRIGKWWRVWPIQHFPGPIEKALKEYEMKMGGN